MKPAAFDYVVADSVSGAIAALGRGDAKIIAGGQSLVPMLNFRLLRPAILVDINRIPDLAFVREDDTAITVGALARHHQLETSPVIARHLPVLGERCGTSRIWRSATAARSAAACPMPTRRPSCP